MEVDPAVVNLTAFETRFEERRPFFIEGANIFSLGGGGGGGGGMIWLEANTLTLAGTLDATGGLGHPLDPSVVLGQAGGNGGPGRIQISSPTLSVTGMVTPSAFTRPDAPMCM